MAIWKQLETWKQQVLRLVSRLLPKSGLEAQHLFAIGVTICLHVSSKKSATDILNRRQDRRGIGVRCITRQPPLGGAIAALLLHLLH